MSSPVSKSVVPMIVAIVAILLAVVLIQFVSDPRLLASLTLIAAALGLSASYLLPLLDAGVSGASETGDALIRNIAESRNEVINAMSILQQEVRLLQESRKAEISDKTIREDLDRLGAEISSLKHAVMQGSPKAEPVVPARPAPAVIESPKPTPVAKPVETDDVAPLSFDDYPDEESPVKKPAPAAKAPAPPASPAKPAPFFEPEPVVDEKGLEPEAMEDDGDWLTGGLEEEDLKVTKKVDFEEIVRKDAARPKPVVDPEEQRALREEMEQMADSEDWVGGGLQDRDVKVRKSTTNDVLFDKFRAEIEAKRQAKESVIGVRAPARGETALIANVSVPSGTRLFVRGVGPGLDVDKGSPMQQSGHGKWQWICPERGKPCVLTIWENDQTQAEGNPVRVPGGFALTVTPTFRRKIRL